MIFIQKTSWLATVLSLIERNSFLVGRSLIVSPLPCFKQKTSGLCFKKKIYWSAKIVAIWFGPLAGYDIEDSSAFPLKPLKSSNVPPAVAAGLGNHTNSKSSKKTRSKNSVASLLYTKYTCYLIHTCLQILVSLFLSL